MTYDLAKVIDERMELKAQIKRMEERLKAIDADLKEEGVHGEIMLGSNGYGVRLTFQEKREYGQMAIRILAAEGLLEHFASVSTTKLEQLRKQGLLSGLQLDALERFSTIKQTPVLRDYIPDEAKIFA